MNVDLTQTFKEGRKLLNTWKQRYTPQEYPYKVVLNIFYRKYTIERMWPGVVNQSAGSWQKAYENNAVKYAQVSQEIVPVLETWVQADRQVGSIKFSDFQAYIKSAARGDANAIKGIEYTYLLHRILDELIMVWIAFVNSGETKINAVAKLTNAVLAPMPIDNYATIEKIFDQLGAERYLQSLFMKEMSGQI